MIGLDTSHAPAFTRLINAGDSSRTSRKMKVVAAYAGGSQDIASSRDRVARFTQEMREMDVVIVPSIEALLPQVDAILLESVDGRKHLEQVMPVFKSGKAVFIDKPLAHNLVDALAIDLLAKKYNARWFSSSSLRFSPSIAKFRNDETLAQRVQGAAAWSPCSLDPTHTDLAWYGIHGIETLYTAMGTGCQSVSRIHTNGTDVVVGKWGDGRVGSFRGIREGKGDYGLIVFGENQVYRDSKYEGYAPLVQQIGEFFLDGTQPVDTQETLEIFTFIEAAEASKDAQGHPIQLSDVLREARIQAERRIQDLDL